MVADFTITGAQQFRDLGTRLRAAGDEGKGLRRELLASIRVAAGPLVDAAKQSALETLPKGGGLNEWTANQKFSVRNRSAGRQAGVRIVATSRKRTSRSNMRLMDVRGLVRHPTFGRKMNPQDWQNTKVPPGWFSSPISKAAPAVQVALLVAMNRTARKITGK